MPDFIKKELAQLSTRYGVILGLLALLWPTLQGYAPGIIQSVAGNYPTVAHWLTIGVGAVGAALIAYREKPASNG